MKAKDLLNLIAFRISSLVPKKENLWVFGSWFGKNASDNPKGLYSYVISHCPDIHPVWLLNDPVKCTISGAKVLKRNSLKGIWTVLRAQVAVMNQGFGDFASFNLLGGAYQVQLWHGVAWKKIVRDSMKEPETRKEKRERAVFDILNSYDLYIAPSENYATSVKTAFQTTDSRILRVGQPRNEVLFDKEKCLHIRTELCKKLGCEGKKLIVYMPTFRDTKSEVFSFHTPEQKEKLVKLAEKHQFVILEKTHFVTQNRGEAYQNGLDDVVYSVPELDAQELLASADVLITDYSSCFFDYLMTDRPIIHFMYDLDYYVNKDRGVYYPADEVICGTYAADEMELLRALDEYLLNPDKDAERRKLRRSEFATYESASNSKVIVKEIQERIKKAKR